MNRIQTFLFGGAVLALSTFTVAFSRTAVYADAQAGNSGTFTQRPGMHRMFGAEAPLISIALKHQTELNLTGDQVATLEKIRTQYQSQTTPIVEQLRSVEGEIRSLLQQSPANLSFLNSHQVEQERPDVAALGPFLSRVRPPRYRFSRAFQIGFPGLRRGPVEQMLTAL